MPNYRHRRTLSIAIAIAMATIGVNALASQGATQTINPEAFGANIGQVSLSPDGTKLAFQKKTAQGWRIFVGSLDGSKQTQITQGPQDDVEPNWRPDGKEIVFASHRTGNFDLFAVAPDGTHLRVLTHTPQDERMPQWSPRQFDFPYDKDPLLKTYNDRPKSDVAPSDLKLLELLAKDSATWDDYKARFATHKAARYYKLLFVEGTGDKRQIGTMRQDSRFRQTIVTTMAGAHLNPCWDRTATRIAFVIHRPNKDTAYVADYPNIEDLNEGENTPKFGINQTQFRKSIEKLGDTQNRGAQIQWTPNGQYIAVASGPTLRLIPEPRLHWKTITLTAPSIAPYGFTWLPDARTALVSVADGSDGTHLHQVRSDDPLLDMVNIGGFDDFSARDRTYLAQNAFVAGGTPSKQMYDIYEETDYSNMPIFVTSDALFHLHHLVFDYMLRGVESQHLMPTTIDLVNHYLQASLQQAKTAPTPEIAQNAKANAAFFAVAARLALGDVKTGVIAPVAVPSDDPLGADQANWRNRQDKKNRAQLKTWTATVQKTLAALPPDIKALSDQEIPLIAEHKGLSESPLFGGSLGKSDDTGSLVDTRIDYSDFIPRGHYTRSEILRRYFLMSRWLSAGPFRARPDLTQRALLIASATDAPTLAQWQHVERAVHEFIGGADDQDLASYLTLAQPIYGSTITLANLTDATKSEAFLSAVRKLPAPKIAPGSGMSFRFLPLPYTPDAEIMQGLVYDSIPPDVGTEQQPRYFSLGLDVMSVLGSERAHTILQDTKFQGTFFDFDLKETEYANYDAQYQALQKQFGAYTEADWSSSLYTRTLYALLPLLTPSKAQSDPNGPASFLDSPAWTDKNLNTALGTWAELKHDTLPKQPTATELGGEGGISEAPVVDQPVGYVEPAPEAYQRLSLLVAAERKTLTDNGYLTPDVSQRLDTLSALLTMIQKIEQKQQLGQSLNAREIEQLRFFGGYLEHLTLVTTEGEQGAMEGNDMAIIADVSSAYSTRLSEQLALEEGVGRALPITVAVTRNGHRELARGAVFTYYEFTHPADDRLTDEHWRELLDSNDSPNVPDWTKSFISDVVKSESGMPE